MNKEEDRKQKFDPYTGNPLEENMDERQEDRIENGSQEPTYQKLVWEPLQEKDNGKREDYSGVNHTNDNNPQNKDSDFEMQSEKNHYDNRNDDQRYLDSQGGTYEYGYGSGYEQPKNIQRDYADKSSGLSTACLILGILSVLAAVSCCFTIFSIPLAIASIVCGSLAEKPRNARDKKRFIGFLMSVISIVVTILMAIFLFIMIANVDFDDFEDDFYDDDIDIDIEEFFDRGQEIEEDFSDYSEMLEL